MNIKNPYVEKGAKPLPKKEATSELLSAFIPTQPEPQKMEIEEKNEGKTEENVLIPPENIKTELEFNPTLDNKQPPEHPIEIKQEPEKEEEDYIRPSMDIFKAIFEDSDEEIIPKPKKVIPKPTPVNLNSTNSLPKETPELVPIKTEPIEKIDEKSAQRTSSNLPNQTDTTFMESNPLNSSVDVEMDDVWVEKRN